MHVPPRGFATGCRPLKVVVAPERVWAKGPFLLLPGELLGPWVVGQVEGLRPPLPETPTWEVEALPPASAPPPIADLARADGPRPRPARASVPDEELPGGARREPRRGVGEATTYGREARVYVRKDEEAVSILGERRKV